MRPHTERLNVKKILIGLMGMIGVLILVIAAKTLTNSWKKQIQVQSVVPLELDTEAIAKHLAEAIRFRTVSHQDPAGNENVAKTTKS